MVCPSKAWLIFIVMLVNDVIKELWRAQKAMLKCPILVMLVQYIHLE